MVPLDGVELVGALPEPVPLESVLPVLLIGVPKGVAVPVPPVEVPPAAVAPGIVLFEIICWSCSGS